MVFWIKWWLKKCEKPKRLKVFFGFSLRSQKETKATNTQKQKKPWVFCFFKVKTKKKTLGKTKKNQTWASDQTFSEKFCFLFFWFSRGFLFFLGFPYGFSPKESLFFLFPTCFDSVHSYYPQDIFKNNWLLYIYAHKYYIYIYIYM